MPSADQVKALISSLADGDETHFYTVAMQIAAHEARNGHGKLAEEIRALIDKAKARPRLPGRGPIPITRPRGEAAEILSVSYPNVRLKDMVLALATKKKLERVTANTATSRSSAAEASPRAGNFFCRGAPGPAKRSPPPC